MINSKNIIMTIINNKILTGYRKVKAQYFMFLENYFIKDIKMYKYLSAKTLEIFDDFQFLCGFIVTAKYLENSKTAKITIYHI